MVIFPYINPKKEMKMSTKVLYVPKVEDLIINEEALRNILGGLPDYPDVGEMPALKAQDLRMLDTKGKLFKTRYDIELGCITFAKFERTRLMVGTRKDDNGNTVCTWDYIQNQSGELDPDTGESAQNTVTVPLEFKDGQWWMHGHLQFRLRMGWTFNCVGGYSDKGKGTEANARKEIAEEFGVAKIRALEIYKKEDGFDFFPDRATFRNGIAVGYFVFEGPSWEASEDPGGFEIINKTRLAIPIDQYTIVPDLVAHSGFSLAQNAWKHGHLKKYEKKGK